MIEINTAEVKFSLQAVRQAALLVRQVQAEMVSPALTKEDRSPVTVADFTSQAVVARFLQEAFPGDPLIAEEDADALRSSPSELEQVRGFVARLIPGAQAESVCAWIDRGAAAPARRFWTLDPIDGTKGFLRGDQYAVALALLVDGQVQVGVLGCPVLSEARRPDLDGPGCLVLAVRGQGAWVTPLAETGPFERLQVSPLDDPSSARLLRSYEAGHTNVSQVDELQRVLGSRAQPVRMDSQAKYAVLASSGGELLVRLLSPAKPDYREKIWDQAAGALVLEEAGGMITDLNGERLDFSAGRTLARNRGVLASNGHLHPAALQALRHIGA